MNDDVVTLITPFSYILFLQGNSLNPGNGQIVQDGNILIITNVNRAQNGDYSCEGKNQYGQGQSKTLNLKVRGTILANQILVTILYTAKM